MGNESPAPDPVGGYAKWYINRKTHELIRALAPSSSDVNDIRQHLTMELFRQIHRYDPRRASPNTFIVRVVDSRTVTLLRRHRRLKRGTGRVTRSADEAASVGNDAPALSGSLTARDLERRTLGGSLDASERLDITEAIAVALRRMPSEAQEVCGRFMAGQTEAAIARDLQISRRQVRNLKAVAQRYLEDAGLGQP